MVDREQFKIEKGVDLKPVQGRRLYPWDDMEVDDSFIVPHDKKAGAASSLTAYRKRNLDSIKIFVSRKNDDGVRYWRTQ